MKSLMISLIFIFVFPFAVFSQNFIDEEIDGLAEQIATKLDDKNNIAKKRARVKTVLVEDFTDTEGNVSKLGASLAEEFSLGLSSAGISFSVTGSQSLAESPNKKSKLNFRRALQGAAKIAEGVVDESNYELNNKTRNTVRSIDGVNDIGTSIEKNKSRYKGIDAVVTGTLTESNDQYRLLIKVISTKKGYKMITNAKGFITKTPFILKLEEEENKRRVSAAGGNDSFASRGGGSSYRGSAVETFASNLTKVELLECKQMGQKIVVHLRIENTGPDVNFYLYGTDRNTRLIDSNNGYDYWGTQVQFGELVDKNRVLKTLVTGTTVEAKITFGGVARDVSLLSKISIGAHGHGGFIVEFRDVRVD